jgi:hypothetical protein
VSKVKQLYQEEMENNWDDMDFAYAEFEHRGVDEELAYLASGQYFEELEDEEL